MASGLSARAHSKVLESATELFAKQGIDATSLDNTLTQAGTAARWERHGIGAQELAMHLLDTSVGIKSATGNLSDSIVLSEKDHQLFIGSLRLEGSR